MPVAPVAPGAPGQYFGWWSVDHAPGCRQPVWEVAVHTDPRSGEHTVRVLCRSCTRVELYSGVTGRESTSTRVTGYGQPPKQVAGVWLYPGPKSTGDEEPYEWLVTRVRKPVEQLKPGDVIGWIGRRSGPRGGRSWSAWSGIGEIGDVGFRIVPTVDGCPKTFKILQAAARWINETGASTSA